jgi:hypothetical protein
VKRVYQVLALLAHRELKVFQDYQAFRVKKVKKAKMQLNVFLAKMEKKVQKENWVSPVQKEIEVK